MMERNSRIEEELFPFYALDALTEEERADVEAYVAINPEARARLAELVEGAAQFGIGVEPVAPSPAVKQQLMARIYESTAAQATVGGESLRQPPTVASPRPQPRSAARQRRRWFTRPLPIFVTAATAALAIIAVISAFFLQDQVNDLRARVQTLQTETIALQTQLDDLEVENATLQERLAEQEEMLAAYRQPGTITIAFGDPTGENRTAVGTLSYKQETQTALLLANNLEPLDQQNVYQLWLIHENTPVSGGTFTVDETGAGSLVVSAVQPGFDAIGVSIEPQGGSEQPTPENIILLGPAS